MRATRESRLLQAQYVREAWARIGTWCEAARVTRDGWIAAGSHDLAVSGSGRGAEGTVRAAAPSIE
jgi:hypothetical protein